MTDRDRAPIRHFYTEDGFPKNGCGYFHYRLLRARLFLEDRMSEVTINERVARMVGWGEGQDLCRCARCSPDFEHSLDACREVLEWIEKQSRDEFQPFGKQERLWRAEFMTELGFAVGAVYKENGQPRWVASEMETAAFFLNATPHQICLAALAVGEKKT